jgi:hypothetical protein
MGRINLTHQQIWHSIVKEISMYATTGIIESSCFQSLIINHVRQLQQEIA